MSDISMCTHPTCPSRERCYRQTAPINPYRQAYAAFEPVGERCEYFVPNERGEEAV